MQQKHDNFSHYSSYVHMPSFSDSNDNPELQQAILGRFVWLGELKAKGCKPPWLFPHRRSYFLVSHFYCISLVALKQLNKRYVVTMKFAFIADAFFLIFSRLNVKVQRYLIRKMLRTSQWFLFSDETLKKSYIAYIKCTTDIH